MLDIRAPLWYAYDVFALAKRGSRGCLFINPSGLIVPPGLGTPGVFFLEMQWGVTYRRASAGLLPSGEVVNAYHQRVLWHHDFDALERPCAASLPCDVSGI